jgi:hypothetical protein
MRLSIEFLMILNDAQIMFPQAVSGGNTSCCKRSKDSAAMQEYLTCKTSPARQAGQDGRHQT